MVVARVVVAMVVLSGSGSVALGKVANSSTTLPTIRVITAKAPVVKKGLIWWWFGWWLGGGLVVIRGGIMNITSHMTHKHEQVLY